MKYKIIASDFDGTLLRSDRTVSRRTVEAIARYRKEGGLFTVSTGRMFDSIRRSLDELGMQDVNVPIIAMDGGIIRESVSGKVLASYPMPKAEVVDFCERCEKIGCYFHIYTDKLYVAKANDINRDYCAVTKIHMNEVGKLSRFVRENELQVLKVLIADDNAEQLLDVFKDRYEGIQFFMSWSTYLDGASVFAGKGNGVRKFAEMHGIDIKDVIAIGDSMNDISMVSEAGLGVAMKNADDRLKKYADMIAPTNDEDGVAEIIERAIRDEL